MWRREEQEVQRFTFRLTTKGQRDEDTAAAEMKISNAGRRKPRVEVTIVGVKPATFNTATFLQRDSEKKRSQQHNDERKDSEKDGEDGGKDNKTLFCVTSHVVWRTSQLMASWMASHASLFAPSGPLVSSGGRSLRVLELGCGLGLAGLACAKVCAALRRPDTPSAEPALVVMTDGDAAALQLLEHNVDLNWTGDRDGRPQVAQLVWGDLPCMRQLKATHGGQAFDVVLGADIIYHRTDYEALIDTIGFFLSTDDGNRREAEQQQGSITNENALVIIAMQERHYGALDHLVQLMRTRLGMAARTLDVPRMFGDHHDEAAHGDDDEDEEVDDRGYIGSNHYMVVFHHPRTTLELHSLGPEVANEVLGDEEDLFLSMSPP